MRLCAEADRHRMPGRRDQQRDIAQAQSDQRLPACRDSLTAAASIHGRRGVLVRIGRDIERGGD